MLSNTTSSSVRLALLPVMTWLAPLPTPLSVACESVRLPGEVTKSSWGWLPPLSIFVVVRLVPVMVTAVLMVGRSDVWT